MIKIFESSFKSYQENMHGIISPGYDLIGEILDIVKYILSL